MRRFGRTLIIVSRDRMDLWGLVRRSGGPRLDVRLDQRLGERREQFRTVGQERRRADRRRLDVRTDLVRLGWAIVRFDEHPE